MSNNINEEEGIYDEQKRGIEELVKSWGGLRLGSIHGGELADGPLVLEGVVGHAEGGLQLWHLSLLLSPLPLLDWEVETWRNGFGGLGLEVVLDVVQHLVQRHIDHNELLILLGAAMLEDIVLTHD